MHLHFIRKRYSYGSNDLSIGFEHDINVKLKSFFNIRLIKTGIIVPSVGVFRTAVFGFADYQRNAAYGLG